MEITEIVREYYNGAVEAEWNRIAGRPEFLLITRFIDRYAMPGYDVLDIGGGPGRYSLYLAERGCNVTLLDISDENVKFVLGRAEEEGLHIQALRGDARYADELLDKKYDCVLLMGPLYHLLDEEDRVKAMDSAVKLLKPGGVIFVSFISVYGGLVYMTKLAPELISSQVPIEVAFRKTLVEGTIYAGDAFTKAFFVQPREVIPFMERFPLEKLHLFGQEGVMTLNEDTIYACGPDTVNDFVNFSEAVCEHEDLLSWSEHLMYVGRKNRS